MQPPSGPFIRASKPTIHRLGLGALQGDSPHAAFSDAALRLLWFR